MIDHVLGRPSVQFRKIQVLAVVSFWTAYLIKGPRHGPAQIRKISRSLADSITPWQTLVMTLLYLYVARNLGKLVGLECPEPLANLYSRAYFRATWVTTALDAGFWSAMRIRRKWLRDMASIVFSLYYLIAAEQADEKVRKVRGMITVDHLRVSWNKGKTPYLAGLSKLMRPRLMRYPPRQIRIPRPAGSAYSEPVAGWLYFDGPLSALKTHTKVVLDIPGGGFVAMDPRTHDDKLYGWAGKTGLPVLSLDYKKAPEYPYPYALNECFDVYSTLVASRGRCVGLSGEVAPKIVLTGDSAGGNLATATIIMILEFGSTSSRQYHGQRALPVPDGLVLMYPGLDLNFSSWMSDEQMSLVRDRRTRKTNRNIIRRKFSQYTLAAGTPHQSDDEDALAKDPTLVDPEDAAVTVEDLPPPPSPRVQKPSPTESNGKDPRKERAPMQTRLAMSSMISYFNDRILTPEMMRAMIILYIGPHNKPDFSTDYLLSPILASDALLARFPKTCILTGERDPLVDDTVIFAGRLRRAKAAAHAQAALDEDRTGIPNSTRLKREFDDRDVVEVKLVPGISHGFMQFVGVFPEGWQHIERCGRWIEDLFNEAEKAEAAATEGFGGSSWGYIEGPSTPYQSEPRHSRGRGGHRSSSHASHSQAFHSRHRSRTEVSSGDEDAGLEMSMSSSRKGGLADETRRQKERLLREQLTERRDMLSQAREAEEARTRNNLKRHGGRPINKRQKSLVSLGSEDDLLGRRMLGLAGPLTGTGEDDIDE